MFDLLAITGVIPLSAPEFIPSVGFLRVEHTIETSLDIDSSIGMALNLEMRINNETDS